MEDPKLTIDHFTRISTIGKGSYAKVILVRSKKDGKRYAMKVLKKQKIKEKNSEAHVSIERQVLIDVDHPFIIKFYFSFQSKNKLFFGLEYCPGGELFNLL